MKNIEALELMKLNQNFENQIISNIPANLNKLEQGLYVYAKLCAVLNYDSHFFASDQKGPAAETHKNIEYVESVDIENNEVVCYDFNLICIRMLEKIGIDAVFKYGANFSDAEKIYGKHSDIYMLVPPLDDVEMPYGLKVGEEIVLFGHSDMTHLKVENRLIARLLDNRYKASGEERLKIKQAFDACLNKVIDIVLEEESIAVHQQNEEILNREKLNVLVSEYSKYSMIEQDFLSDNDKINIFLEQVSKIDLGDIASLKYAQRLYSQIEDDLENKEKYGFTIIKEKIANDVYGMVGVISFVGEDMNYYLKITPPNIIQEIKHRELQQGFNDGIFDYIGAYFNANHIIPDIKSEYIEENCNLEVARAKLQYFKEYGRWLDGEAFNIAKRLIDYCAYIDNMCDKSFVENDEIQVKQSFGDEFLVENELGK